MDVYDTAELTRPELVSRLLVDSAPDILVLLQPDGRCRYFSPATQALLGLAPASLSGADLHDLVVEDDRAAVDELLSRISHGDQVVSFTVRMLHQAGDWLWMEGHARRLSPGSGAVLALRDITERKQAEAVLEEANALLRRRASEDLSTGLPNRGHFLSLLARELRRARRDGIGIGVLVVEAHGLAHVSGIQGHDVAENIMAKVAEVICGALRRPADMAGRLTNCTIGVMLPATLESSAAEVAYRLRIALTQSSIAQATGPDSKLSFRIGSARSEPSSVAADLVQVAEWAVQKDDTQREEPKN